MLAPCKLIRSRLATDTAQDTILVTAQIITNSITTQAAEPLPPPTAHRTNVHLIMTELARPQLAAKCYIQDIGL